jgi:hypothetical protein
MIAFQILAQSEASKFKSYEDAEISCQEKQMQIPIIRNSNELTMLRYVMIDSRSKYNCTNKMWGDFQLLLGAKKNANNKFDVWYNGEEI